MDKPIHTIYEAYVARLLDYLDIPYEIDRLICFECNGARFYWPRSEIHTCQIGMHVMQKGQFCRPDFLIVDKRAPMPLQTHTIGYEPIKMSVLRIDGEIHDKKRIMARDRAQERELKRIGMEYFVIDNEELKWEADKHHRNPWIPAPNTLDYSRIPREHLDRFIAIWYQTLNKGIYDKYEGLRSIKASKLV